MHKLGNDSMTANDKRNEIKAYLRQGETFTMPVLHFWSATMYMHEENLSGSTDKGCRYHKRLIL